MLKEFGPVSNPNENIITPGNETESNSLSECTSLASWGRNLLMERNGTSTHLIAVFPADSLSTRAAPIFTPPSNFSNSPIQNLSFSLLDEIKENNYKENKDVKKETKNIDDGFTKGSVSFIKLNIISCLIFF